MTTISQPGRPPGKFFLGLWTRRERWGLTARGWLVLFLTGLAFFWWLAHAIHPFLAPTRRVETKFLVVEGWIPPYALRAAVAEFQAGGYEKVFVTGGPVVGSGGYINDFQTSASVGAELLIQDGLAADRVVMTPSHIAGRDRTYSSAVALRVPTDVGHKNYCVIDVVLFENGHVNREVPCSV